MNTITLRKAVSVAAGAVLLSLSAVPAFAQVGVQAGVSVGASVGASSSPAGVRAELRARAAASTTASRDAQMASRAGTEIANRIAALNQLEVRVNAMQRLSDSEKSSLSSQVQAQITAMNALQSRISADLSSNNTSSLKDDVQSIAKAYRIYALVLPQGMIAAASDRIMTIVDAMTAFSGILQTRITEAQTAGANMSASVSALSDMQAKIADAKTKAQAAVSVSTSLAPDNGSSTLMAANTSSLKAARNNIQAAQQDLVAARQDAAKIIAAVKAAVRVQASTTVATSTP